MSATSAGVHEVVALAHGAHHHVGVGDQRGEVVEGRGGRAELAATGFAFASVRFATVRLPTPSLRRRRATRLAGVARAQHERGERRERAGLLLQERERRAGQRHGAPSDLGLRADALARREGVLEETEEQGARRVAAWTGARARHAPDR